MNFDGTQINIIAASRAITYNIVNVNYVHGVSENQIDSMHNDIE